MARGLKTFHPLYCLHLISFSFRFHKIFLSLYLTRGAGITKGAFNKSLLCLGSRKPDWVTWLSSNICSILHCKNARKCHALCVSRVLKYPKKCLQHLTTFFMSTWWLDCKKMQKKSRWLFEIIHIIRFEMHMDRRDKSENIVGIWSI